MRDIEDLSTIELVAINEAMRAYKIAFDHYWPQIQSAIKERDDYWKAGDNRKAGDAHSRSLSLIDQMESAEETMDKVFRFIGVSR